MATTDVILINADGSLCDDVHILVGPYSLEVPSRTYADLVKFLKVVKGVKGSITFYLDPKKQQKFTEQNYDADKAKAIGGKLYYTAEDD